MEIMQEINGRYKIRIPCPDGRAGCGVCHYAHIDVDAYNTIHDCYVDNYNVKPIDSIVARIFKVLPKEIHDLAKQWDWNDTEVRDMVHHWMSERIIAIL